MAYISTHVLHSTAKCRHGVQSDAGVAAAFLLTVHAGCLHAGNLASKTRCASGGPCACQLRLKIPHCTGGKFPPPEPHEWASLASDGVEPSAVFWRALGGTESEAKERAAASAPSCPPGVPRPAWRPALRRCPPPPMSRCVL